MLLTEFRRAGISFSLQGRRLIDAQTIFHREEPRDLSAAAQFYLEREHREAHTALGDIRTTAAVLSSQLQKYPHIPKDLDGLHAYCDEVQPFRTELDKWFDRREGALVFRRGKHRGEPLTQVAATAPDYLQWMLGAEDMDEEVLQAVRAALEAPPSEA
jgi:DNA polymerase-3 subunit epsilon